MRSDIKDYLYNICNKENIRVVWLENLSPYTPPSASFEHRCIVMNPNWHNKFEFTFQLARQLPQSKDMGLVTHDLTVSGNNATSLLPHYTWLHHWVVGSTHLTNTFTH